jgi:hypothetical protein
MPKFHDLTMVTLRAHIDATTAVLAKAPPEVRLAVSRHLNEIHEAMRDLEHRTRTRRDPAEPS